ncbi:hypothetical protein PDESU_01177 [Pontiella desulfatans]|uniref:Helix-turn-helix domain-containing protein n=1 Tax=Pontiella desulfatans TaxID=2750659 RepID=A0A6C2TYT6_PONDE|nr:helix-turn-helix domain-containing protein [Pontiella desulfatans]VGO12624.1 hypothetical protein PDESU_01177 [Pontiella desulfatans]
MTPTRIPQPIAEAAIAMLRPYAPDLTIEKLEAALFQKTPPNLPDKLLTRKEAAKLLNVSIPTIDRMLRDGELPHRHIRRAVRITLSAVNLLTENKG